MLTFVRQQLIPGWDQDRLRHASVLVQGKNLLGVFLVSGLQSLGIGRVDWVGIPEPAVIRCMEWLTLGSGVAQTTRINDFDFEIEYPADLDVLLGCDGRLPDLFIGTTPAEEFTSIGLATRGVPSIWASAANGCWIRSDPLPHSRPCAESPADSMMVAGLLLDRVRAQFCPLLDVTNPTGAIGLAIAMLPATSRARSKTIQIGVGGVGTYSALPLAAAGLNLHLVDDDRIEDTNLNRQGLFRSADVGKFKSEVAASVLNRLFPEAKVTHEIQRVDAYRAKTIASADDRPSVVISAVDNARTRLCLQDACRDSEVAVVQGGTDLFSADCFVQSAGPTLDEQMHGALTAAAEGEESERRRGACLINPAYVAPSMVAGAMVARRVAEVLSGREHLAPLRWRAGMFPIEDRTNECIEDLFASRS